MKLNNSVRKVLTGGCVLICLGVILSYLLPKAVHAPVYENNDVRPTGASRSLSQPTVAIQKLASDGSVIEGQVGIGTFVSSNGYLLTAKHVIESGVYGIGVIDNKYTIINEEIIVHPTQDLALLKLYAVTAPCVSVASYEGDDNVLQDITYPTEITPGMSGTPLYNDTGFLEGIITQRDQTDTKKGQGTFLSPSLVSWINAHLSQDYTTSCSTQ